MDKKIKLAAGTLAVISCLFLGCEKKEEELLLPVDERDLGISSEEGLGSGVALGNEGNGVPGSVSGGESAGAKGSIDAGDAISSGPGGSGGDTLSGGQAAAAQDAGAASGDIGEVKDCVVHICGAVNLPGVYTLKAGSRIYQAVEEAGGFSGDADEEYLNLADLVADGMKIYVPTEAEVIEAEGTGGSEGAGKGTVTGSGGVGIIQGAASGGIREKADGNVPSDSLVNINTAGEELLCTLPGIGSSKAKSIIAYREKNGAFQKTEDIMNVEGIKNGLFQKIKDNITV